MKKRIFVITMCFILLFTMFGCGEESTYQSGSWYEDQFMSSWTGLYYTLPDGVKQVTDESMTANRYLYSGVFYGESDEPTVKDLEDVVTIEMGAYYLNETYSIWIMTEEIPNDTLTVDDWIDEYVEQISNTVAEYKVNSRDGEATINGETYREVKLSASAMGVHMYQDLYIRQKENRMVYVLVVYAGQFKEDAQPLLMSGLKK